MKNILFISPKFFGYEDDIKQVLRSKNNTVLYFDDRPNNTFLMKVLLRMQLNTFITKFIDRYYEEIFCKVVKEKLDIVFLLNPEATPIWFLNRLKQRFPNLKVITYFWDSFKNRSGAGRYLAVSEKFFTFDPLDATQDERICFEPLFAVNDFYIQNNEQDPLPAVYDLLFVGTLHSDRWQQIKNIQEFCKKNELKLKYYLYSPSYFLFVIQRYLLGQFRHIRKDDVAFKSLSREALVQLMASSTCIIDIHAPNQVGLTIRTIESLAMGKKIITTNAEIKNYNFYNRDMHMVISRDSTCIDVNFVRGPVNNTVDVTKQFELENWLDRLLEVN